ncbi:MAG: hypothetical protein DIU71_12390 [Proteobacteria bacterium]|nr:MAG: hypothetical protein DIU71_12390 [Pseudomonadota bacterium]
MTPRRNSLRALLCALALAAPAAAQAQIAIEIPKVAPFIANNVRAFLSLSRYAERQDVTPEVMGRLQRRIVTETRQALEPLGFYEPEVTYEIARNGTAWTVTIHITPGRPVRLSEVNIEVRGPGAGERAIREVLDAREIKPGLRLNHGAYEKVKADLLRAARNEGYLDARLVKSELVIDRVERRSTVSIVMDTGAQYRYGDIAIAQDVIDEEAMRRLLRMREGEPYTMDSLLRTQYVLDDSQYFSAVEIETAAPDPQTHTVATTVRAEPNRRHRYAAGIGYATDTRARGRFTWDDRRVNRRGHRSKLELTGSSVVQEAAARYIVPVMDVALEKVEFSAIWRHEELGSTLSERYDLGLGLTEVLGQWQRVLFVRLSNETTTVPATETTPEARNRDFLIIPGISFATMPSHLVGRATRPYFAFAELTGSPSTFGSDASFLRLRVQLERRFALSDLWSLRLRGEVGASWIMDAAFTDLPASQRFFAGGDRSVRGFALNELSPVEVIDGVETGNRIGGRHLATGTVELERALPRSFGVAAFYDFGNAFDSFSDPMLKHAVGLGLRWHIAVASLGIDVAQPLAESGRGPRLHLYISTLF